MPDDPFYDGHRMTRRGMEQWLSENQGSVLHTNPDGTKRLITHPSQLPSEAELAKGNRAAETRVRGDLQAQLNSIQRQLATLPADAPAATAPEAETADADAPKAKK